MDEELNFLFCSFEAFAGENNLVEKNSPGLVEVFKKYLDSKIWFYLELSKIFKVSKLFFKIFLMENNFFH